MTKETSTDAAWRDAIGQYWPGLLLASVIAIASTFISESRGGPTLLYALLLGMALQSVTVGGRAMPGVDFAARRVLRLGVALLGARITFEQVTTLGWRNVALVLAGVAVTIGFGFAVARRFGLSRRLGVLTGGATAICGASAAIAIASVLPRDERSERELIFTVAGVTALSTVAMIIYPVIVHWAGLDAHQTGVFLGGTIHDVAQVVGAGYSISPQAGDYAVLTKLLRVAMLAPVVMGVTVAVRRTMAAGDAEHHAPLLPAFLVGFVALAIVSSLGYIPAQLSPVLNDVSRGCLVVAIAAVGLKTSLLEVKKVGPRALALLCAETVFLAVFVLGTQKLLD